jgi:hypothetical protein
VIQKVHLRMHFIVAPLSKLDGLPGVGRPVIVHERIRLPRCRVENLQEKRDRLLNRIELDGFEGAGFVLSHSVVGCCASATMLAKTRHTYTCR